MKTRGFSSNVWTRISSCVLLSILAICWINISESNQDVEQFAVDPFEFKGNKNTQKNIFVFLDGTKNTRRSQTNVRRLYEIVTGVNDPQITAIYIEGVGSVKDAPLTGPTLGRGMEKRIITAYNFIADNYSVGDNIYLFGFSRGAHQARALAGLISYGGVPEVSDVPQGQLVSVSNSIIELIKKQSDEDYLEKWSSWHPDQQPMKSSEIMNKIGISMRSAEIKFLGVWDTVPGSSLKDYGDCKEHKGIVKRYFYLMIPGIDRGERYKTDSYPPIRRITHAVSTDEKRSKFAPLLLCKAINPQYTEVTEVWFPGAHADVGGGYDDEDSDKLPSISLEWMMKKLSKSYTSISVPDLNKDAKGLAHWSIGDAPANIGSACVDRKPGEGAEIHQSVYDRRKASPVPIKWKGVKKLLNYPINCSDE